MVNLRYSVSSRTRGQADSAWLKTPSISHIVIINYPMCIKSQVKQGYCYEVAYSKGLEVVC